MTTFQELQNDLIGGRYDTALEELCAAETSTTPRQRALRVVEAFGKAFSPAADAEVVLFSAPGRIEIGGNHTDHQHGRVLCAGIDLDMLACASPNGSNIIRIASEGYSEVRVCLDQLSPVAEERSTSAALVRGVAAAIAEKGYSVGGFDLWMTSDVLPGSGLSSSAAYEVLMGNVMNRFFCGDALDAVTVAKIGQYAENVYFEKPCGLMDQMASAVGGIIAIDFADPAVPVLEQVVCDFSAFGHALCIVDTGSCHSDLTGDFEQIIHEMAAVSEFFGNTVLREVPEEEFRGAIPRLRERCGDRAVLRALHFYNDNRRAEAEAAALKCGDFETFLHLVNVSGLSSALYLQNNWSVAAPDRQAIPLALAAARELLQGTGAVRVHGGGFAGTIQAFVPEERLDTFKSGMEMLFGKGSCHVLHIRSRGGCAITI